MTEKLSPTKKGTDLESTDGKYGAHVRLEKSAGEWVIAVDVFDSAIKSPNKAHVESDAFPITTSGAREATRFLRSYGFKVRVEAPKPVR